MDFFLEGELPFICMSYKLVEGTKLAFQIPAVVLFSIGGGQESW